jgi:DNA polymerase-3 subunit gamma/tau
MRDAYNLLEQLYTYYGANINFLQVQATLGITGDWRAKEIVKHILQNDISGGMSTLNSVNNDGLDLHQFNRELVDYLRALLLVKTGAPEISDLSSEDISELKELSSKASLAQILNAVKLFGQIQLGNNEGSSLPMELALVECFLANERKSSVPESTPSSLPIPAKAAIPSLTRAPAPAPARAAIQPPPGAAASPPAKAPVASAPSPEPVRAAVQPSSQAAAPASSIPAKAGIQASPESRPEEKLVAQPAPAMVKEGPAKPVSLSSEIERLRLNWKQIIEGSDISLRKTNAAALLKSSSRPVSVENDTIVLAFAYELLKQNMEKPEAKRIAEQILSNYLGHPCQISCVCDPKKDHLVNLAKKYGGQVTSVEEK